MALKAQLESSSKELNQTMEQMEQSRKDVESAVEGWPGEGLSNVFWGLHVFGFPRSFFLAQEDSMTICATPKFNKCFYKLYYIVHITIIYIYIF